MVFVVLGATPGTAQAVESVNSISGTLLHDDQSPLDGSNGAVALVAAYLPTSDEPTATAQVNPDGSWTIANLPDGEYVLYVSVASTDADSVRYLPYWQNGGGFKSSAQRYVSSSLEPTTGVFAYLKPSSIAQGFVVDSRGNVITGAVITAVHELGWPTVTGTTGDNGRYRLETDRPGEYFLKVTPPDSRFVAEWYQDATSQDSATSILFPEATSITIADVMLSGTPSISGAVTNSSGTGIPGIQVSALSTNPDSFSSGSATTAADGSYTVSGLALDSYRVLFSDPEKDHSDAVFGGSSVENAAHVAVSAEAPFVDNVSVTLVGVGSIAGTVVGSDGPLAGFMVTASADGVDVNTAFTDEAGNYRITDLPFGSYSLYFQETANQGYLAQSVSGPFTVTQEARRVTGANFESQLGGSITGKISSSYGYTGSVKVFDGDSEIASIQVNAVGSYRIDDIPAGSYTVQFDIGSSKLGDGWFPAKWTQAEASKVIVVGGQTTANINNTVRKVVSPGTTYLYTPRNDSVSVGQKVYVKLGTLVPAAPTVSYQWVRIGEDSSTPIAGAIGNAYIIKNADVGFQIGVIVTMKASGYAPLVREYHHRYGAITVAGGKFTTVPATTISGALDAGSTLTATAGTFVPAPDEPLRYTWLRNGIAIPGHVGQLDNTLELLPARDYIGARVTVIVSASKHLYNNAQSSKTVNIRWKIIKSYAPVVKPTTTAVVGTRLTATAGGTWHSYSSTLGTVAITYKWLRNGEPIAGATTSAYVVTAEDQGASIQVAATGTSTFVKDGVTYRYTPLTRLSAAKVIASAAL